MTICGDGDAFFAWPEVVSAKTRSELRNERPEHFADKLPLAEIHASLERAADVLRTVKGSPRRGVSDN